MVLDCGLVFPGADPGFQVEGIASKKFRRVKRGAKMFGVFCVKNQDCIQKNIFFSNFSAPLESATDSGSDNNST